MHAWNGSAMRRARLDAQLSPELVAVCIGRSAGMIYRYERSDTVPSLETAAAIAEVLGVPLTILLAPVSGESVR